MIKTTISCFSIIIICLFIMACSDVGSDKMELAGYVLMEDEAPVEGVDVTFIWPDLKSGPVVVVTDADGWYSYKYGEVFEDDRVTITPSHPDYDFEPIEYDLPEVHEDQLDLDFLAIPVD